MYPRVLCHAPQAVRVRHAQRLAGAGLGAAAGAAVTGPPIGRAASPRHQVPQPQRRGRLAALPQLLCGAATIVCASANYTLKRTWLRRSYSQHHGTFLECAQAA